MSKYPSFSGKKLIKVLSVHGFEVVRIKGSHHRLRHIDGRATVIPVHSKEDIGRGLLRKIPDDCDLILDDIV